MVGLCMHATDGGRVTYRSVASSLGDLVVMPPDYTAGEVRPVVG